MLKWRAWLRSSAQERPELRRGPRSTLSQGRAPPEDSLGWVYSSCSHRCRRVFGGASPPGTSRVLEGDSRGRLRRGKRELRPHGKLNHLYGAFFPGSLRPIILICQAHSPYLVYLRILLRVDMHLLTKMDSTTKAYG